MTKRVRTTRRLEVWLKDTSIALFVLNAHRRLVFFNVGCERLTGWTAADVLGQVCDYVTESDANQPAAILASLAPPAGVWSGQTISAPVVVAHRNSDATACQIHFYPLTDVEQKVQAALGIIQPAVPLAQNTIVPISAMVHAELAALRQTLRQRFGEGSLIGRCPQMRRVFEQLKLAQQSGVPVLLIGEAGAGREHLARSIHYARESHQRSFVPLDCRHLPADHLEATLHRITGSAQSDMERPGTVYFDNIEALPRDIQRLVLELIESNHPSKPRVMAASRKALDPLVESDDFIGDLHLALTSLSILVPPLRNRDEDLELLAQHLLEEQNRGSEQQINGFHDDVWQQFHRYDWPGNVGELRTVVIEARQQCHGPLIETSNLPFRFRTGVDRQSVGPTTLRRTVPLDPLLLQVEKEQIELALAEAKQNKAKAAELLGITRPRLYRRMELLGIIDPESTAREEQPE